MAIVIFSSYISALLNIYWGINMIFTMVFARGLTIPFNGLIVYLSKRLDSVYFVVGTLTLYMLTFQGTIHMSGITGGVFGLSEMTRSVWGYDLFQGLSAYFLLSLISTLVLLIGITLFKKTYIFTLLRGRGEQPIVLRVFGVSILPYTYIMVIITSLCATIGANLYTFYFLFIDPRSFWFTMVSLILVISFLSYNANERQTLAISLLIVFVYEYLRFFKMVDPTHLGYIREGLFAVIIMITSYLIFKRISFGRNQ